MPCTCGKAAQGRLVGKIDTRTIVFKSIADSRSSALISKIVKQTIQSRADCPLISFIRLVRYFGVIPEPLGEIRHVPVGRMFLDDRPHEPECQFFLMGISSLFSLRIIEIDGVDVPIEHPQKLHYRLTATDDGSIFGTVSQQVAEIQEPPDILFPRLRAICVRM